MASYIIGIDPGLSGGIAIVGKEEYAFAAAMPDSPAELMGMIEGFLEASAAPCVAFVEKVGATPQMGVVSAFKFGQSVGYIRMACIAAGIRLEYVTPQKWQRYHGLIVKGRGLGQGDTEKKNRNKARAQELFPGMKITHATADALLIAYYGRRIENGKDG